MIRQLETRSPRVLGFKLSGKLHDEDYTVFVPAVEAAIAAQGRMRMLACFEDFEGWDRHAAGDDFTCGVKHYGDIERLAVVGGDKREEWMARFRKPFTRAEVKCFPRAEINAAWAWLRNGH